MVDEIHPLTPDRWTDVEQLFGAKGACAGCWCQFWRQRAPEWKARTGEGNREAFRDQVRRGPPPGLLGYADGRPVAWCQLGPRESFARVLAAPSKQPIDARPTWLLNCFFVTREQRGRGWMTRLVRAAIEHARAQGAEFVEAWPVSGDKPLAATFAYVGHAPTLEKLGFRAVEVRVGQRVYRRHRLQVGGPE